MWVPPSWPRPPPPEGRGRTKAVSAHEKCLLPLRSPPFPPYQKKRAWSRRKEQGLRDWGAGFYLEKKRNMACTNSTRCTAFGHCSSVRKLDVLRLFMIPTLKSSRVGRGGGIRRCTGCCGIGLGHGGCLWALGDPSPPERPTAAPPALSTPLSTSLHSTPGHWVGDGWGCTGRGGQGLWGSGLED